MNGLIREAITHGQVGHRVILLAEKLPNAQVWDLLRANTADVARFRRAHGSERVDFNSGGSIVFARTLFGVRGYEVDVIVMESGGKFDNPHAIANIAPATNARGGFIAKVIGGDDE